MRAPGEPLERLGARQPLAPPAQPPPRATRYEPELGPPGSVTAPPG